MLVGDSISILYAPYLKEYIDDCFNLRLKGNQSDAIINLDNPKGANAGNSRMILDYLKHFKETDVNFNDDIILLNCGLHDIKTDPISNVNAISLSEYKSNLDSIYWIIMQLNKNSFGLTQLLLMIQYTIQNKLDFIVTIRMLKTTILSPTVFYRA